MKTIGFIGGMSWESSSVYYRIVNQEINNKKGKSHSSKNIMFSLDFQEIAELQHAGEWEKLTIIMRDTALRLEKAGADFIVICTNTMHLMAPELEEALNIPLLHIADAVAEEIKNRNLYKVGLLGTRFTMGKGFYKERLYKNHDIEVIIPEAEDRKIVHDIIYNELVFGEFHSGSRRMYQEVVTRLQRKGAEGVILGCTEIPLLLNQEHSEIPLFDTTKIHARKAVDWSLDE